MSTFRTAPRTIVFALFTLALGIGIGSSLGHIEAQPAAATSVCVEISGVNSLRNLNETIRRQESMGYELSTFSPGGLPCFRHR